jgi:hypothetical protein
MINQIPRTDQSKHHPIHQSPLVPETRGTSLEASNRHDSAYIPRHTDLQTCNVEERVHVSQEYSCRYFDDLCYSRNMKRVRVKVAVTSAQVDLDVRSHVPKPPVVEGSLPSAYS